MTPRYPFVLFDVGETLVGPRVSYGAVYSEVLRGLGIPLGQADLDRGIRTASRELARAVPSGADRFSWFPGGEIEFWTRFARRSIEVASGKEIDAGLVGQVLGALREAFKKPSAWLVYDDVIPALEGLRAVGCRLGVVSNWDSRLPEILRALALDRFFETVAVSGLERIEKPDPRLFEIALTRMDAAAGDALHVGNVPELDVEGARAAGVAALLVDRDGSFQPAGHVVRDLGDLTRIAVRGIPG